MLDEAQLSDGRGVLGSDMFRRTMKIYIYTYICTVTAVVATVVAVAVRAVSI